MNYFCSLFKYANFSNNFSFCQKPYQKNNPPKNLEGLLNILKTALSAHRFQIGMTWAERALLL